MLSHSDWEYLPTRSSESTILGEETVQNDKVYCGSLYRKLALEYHIISPTPLCEILLSTSADIHPSYLTLLFYLTLRCEVYNPKP